MAELDPTAAGESTTDEDRQQPSALDNEDLFRRLKNWYQQSRDASSDWRKAAREDYGFYSGEQWDSQDKARLMDQLRPVITFNRIAPTIDTVAGMEVNNRQEIRCYPRVSSSPASPQPSQPATPSMSPSLNGAGASGANGIPSMGAPTAMSGATPPMPPPSGANGGAPQAGNRLGIGAPMAASMMQLPPGPSNGSMPPQIGGVVTPASEASQAETLTDAIKWVRDECDAEDEESEAFIDSVICGMGWTETRLDYETEPDGMIDQDRVDPLEMYWDSFARKRNLTDSRFVMHRTEIDIQTARDMFPDAEDEDLHAHWATVDDLSQDPQDATQDRFYQDDGKTPAGLVNRRKCTIVHAQWYEKEAFYRVADPLSKEMKSLSVAEYRQVNKRGAMLGLPPIKGVKQERRTYKRAFLGRVVLETGDAPCKWAFTFQAITGKRDRNKKLWYGIVASMKDPQRWANKFFSTIIHSIASQGKGIIAERGAFEDDDTAQADWAHPDRIVFTKPGAIAGGKLMPKPAGTFPTGLPDMLTFALGSLRDVSGINLEIMGQQSNDQAASLEWQRRKSAFSILAGYFDALRHYRKEQGRLLIYLVQEYISDGRLMRITTDNGQPAYVPFNRSPKFVEYDVIVDDAPSSPDQKEATWQILGGMMPLLAKLPIPLSVWTEIVKQSPLPDSFSSKIATLLQQSSQNPSPPPEIIKAQIEAQADKEKSDADIALRQQEAAADIQLRQVEMQGDAQTEQMRQHVDAAKAAGELEIQRERLAADVQLKREEIAANLQLKREELAAQTAVTRETEDRKIEVAAASAGVAKPKAKRGPITGPDPVVESLKDLVAAHMSGMKEHTDTLAKVMTRPRKVIYGADGRPSGVE